MDGNNIELKTILISQCLLFRDLVCLQLSQVEQNRYLFKIFKTIQKAWLHFLVSFMHKSWHFPREQEFMRVIIKYHIFQSPFHKTIFCPQPKSRSANENLTSNSFLCCFGLSRLRWCSVLCRTYTSTIYPSL